MVIRKGREFEKLEQLGAWSAGRQLTPAPPNSLWDKSSPRSSFPTRFSIRKEEGKRTPTASHTALGLSNHSLFARPAPSGSQADPLWPPPRWATPGHWYQQAANDACRLSPLLLSVLRCYSQVGKLLWEIPPSISNFEVWQESYFP